MASLYTLLILLVAPVIIFGEKLYMLKATSYQCTEIDPVHIVNMTCRLKPKRHGAGILSTIYKYQNAEDVAVHLQLFYRNSGGRYLPYILNLKIDLCERSRLYKNGPLLVKMMLDILFTHKEYLTYKCPFNYLDSSPDLDIDDQLAKYLPSNIVATGEYKFSTRCFNGKTNKTYYRQTVRIQVTANGVKGSMADLSMLNMG